MWASRETVFRSTDDWKDATILTEAAICEAVLGLDVGQFSHWACRVSRRGEVLGSGPVNNTERDRLASYRGIAPRNRQPGGSISSVSSSHRGNKRLKSPLILSCNSLCRSKGRFGDHYRSCRNRGMCHKEALKAFARKRLKVIYAIMGGDTVPYSA